MELSSPESILTALIAASYKPEPREIKTRAPRRWKAANAPAASGPASRRPRCRCGTCRECADNARWERIFQEKFADPDYYNRSHIRHGSPLESL